MPSLARHTINEPLVTAVITTYKRGEFLSRAIESVRNQTYSNWELIVVDDNEPDSEFRESTIQVMDDYQDDCRIRFVCHEANKGGSASRNTGISHAAGKYIAFLDDDDEWLPEKTAKQVEVFERLESNVAMLSTDWEICDSVRNIRIVRQSNIGRIGKCIDFELNRLGPTSMIMCKTIAVRAICGFDELLPARQDIDFYLRMSMSYSIHSVPIVLMRYHIHGEGAVSENVDGKIRASESFYRKHKAYIEKTPTRVASFAERLGELRLRNGEFGHARREFARAIRRKPLWIRLYAKYVGALLGRRVYSILQSLYRVTRKPFGILKKR